VPALDTNALVRYLVADDKKQFQLAQTVIDTATEDDPLFLPLSVVVELEWVLRSRYDFNKETLIRTFNQLLSLKELAIQDEQTLEIAVSLYTDHNTGFADCLHTACTHYYEYSPLVTFDRKAARLPDATLLA